MWWGRFTPQIFFIKREKKKSTYLRLETSGPHRELLEDRCEDFLSPQGSAQQAFAGYANLSTLFTDWLEIYTKAKAI